MISTHELYQICMKIYEGVTAPINWFVLPLFLIRVSVAQLSGDSAEIRAAIKGLILYFVLIVTFGMILDLLLQIPQNFIPEVTPESIGAKTRALTQEEKHSWEAYLKTIPEIVSFLGECLLALIYWVMVILHILVMVLMTAMAPIIFLLSCVGNIGVPVRIFFGLIIMSSCWPVLWYGFDQALPFIEKVIPNEFGKLVLTILLTFFKAVGPFLIAYMSVNSGPGKAAVMAINHLLDFSQKTSNVARGIVSDGVSSIAKSSPVRFLNSRTQGTANFTNNNETSRTIESQDFTNSKSQEDANQTAIGEYNASPSSRIMSEIGSNSVSNNNTTERSSSAKYNKSQNAAGILIPSYQQPLPSQNIGKIDSKLFEEQTSLKPKTDESTSGSYTQRVSGVKLDKSKLIPSQNTTTANVETSKSSRFNRSQRETINGEV